jgi:hypothetical protein
MSRSSTPVRFATLLLLSVPGGCFLDTAPILDPAGSQDAGLLPPTAASDAASPSPVQDAAAAAPPPTAPVDAAAPVQPAAPEPPPSADNGSPDASTEAPPAPARCQAVGSYGLRTTLDVAWEATDWADVGRGTVELYGLVQVESIDAKTGKTAAGFRACGVVLPAFSSAAVCSSYQLQFPAQLWDSGALPEQTLAGRYECKRDACQLRLDPIAYDVGIELEDKSGHGRGEADATAQFPDDDGDGVAGVSADLVSSAERGPGPLACGPAGRVGPTGESILTQLGSLPLGLHAQLTAAMQLAGDCQLLEPKASEATLGVRYAGCLAEPSAGPAGPGGSGSACSEALRSGVDQTLPSYQVLGKDEAPAPSNLSDRQKSSGPTLQAIRFAAGEAVSCERVRSAMYGR